RDRQLVGVDAAGAHAEVKVGVVGDGLGGRDRGQRHVPLRLARGPAEGVQAAGVGDEHGLGVVAGPLRAAVRPAGGVAPRRGAGGGGRRGRGGVWTGIWFSRTGTRAKPWGAPWVGRNTRQASLRLSRSSASGGGSAGRE